MSKIFNLNNGIAVAMDKHQYEKEADLQKIVAKNPDLIRRNDDVLTNTRYYLVQQEMKFPDSDFSLDHLMIDSYGVPVLVEVKRSTDTRIRREVVAQMLEYASRAKLWQLEELQENFQIENPDTDLSEEVWGIVEKSLKDETMRLVFVADEIPQSLRLLIDFMNRSMQNIEVYGVEVIPFESKNGAKMLTVNTIETASKVEKQRENTREQRPWDQASVMQYMESNKMQAEAKVLPQFLEVAVQKGFELAWGKGARFPSVSLRKHNASIMRLQAVNYSAGATCPTEVKTYHVLRNGNEQLDEKVKQTFRDSLAWRKNDEHKPPISWESQQYQYISLKVFDDQATIADFLERLSRYADLITEVLPQDSY